MTLYSYGYQVVVFGESTFCVERKREVMRGRERRERKREEIERKRDEIERK